MPGRRADLFSFNGVTSRFLSRNALNEMARIYLEGPYSQPKSLARNRVVANDRDPLAKCLKPTKIVPRQSQCQLFGQRLDL